MAEEVRATAHRVIERASGNDDALLVAALSKEHVSVTQAFLVAVETDS